MNRWWVKIGRYALPYRGQLAAVVVLTLSYSALEALKPWPLKLVVDHVLAGKALPAGLTWVEFLPGASARAGVLAWLTAATVLIYLAGPVAQLLQSYVQAGLGARMTYRLGADLFDHVQRLSLQFHARRRVGDLVHRIMNDAGCAQELALGVFLPLLTSVTMLAIMLTVLLWMNPWLTLVALATAPLLYFVIRRLAGPMSEWEYRQAELQGQVMASAEQSLAALPIVQAFGQERREHSRFSNVTRSAGKAYLRTVLVQMKFSVGVGLVTALGTAALMYAGGTQVLSGRISIGELLVFLAYLHSLYGPILNLAYLSQGYASAAAGARRVLEIFEDQSRLPELVAPLRLSSPCRGEIGFHKVTFGYEPGRPVLHGIELLVRPGECVALVGPSGAGKSTLAGLIPRLFDPWEGSVRIDGTDVRSLALRELRSQVAVLLQEPFLQQGTIAENIAYGRPEASHEEIRAAAQAAGAEEFILSLPEGYDTLIGDRGMTLSGGERQRIAIARALIKNAPILILDEPTSALDAATETSLMDALERLMEGRTTVLIAHRLSTARRADRVAFLEEGRIVEEGGQAVLDRWAAAAGPSMRTSVKPEEWP